MDRYMIISGHTAEDCRRAVKYFMEFHANYLTHFEWGCKDNDHNAYTIIEAESHEQALLSVPPLFRDKARVIKLTKFYPKKDVDEGLHKKNSSNE